MFYIYVDGSCIGNQNVDQNTPAGWGVVIVVDSNDLGRGNGEIFHEFHQRKDSEKMKKMQELIHLMCYERSQLDKSVNMLLDKISDGDISKANKLKEKLEETL